MTKNMVEDLDKWSHNEIKEAVSSATCSEGTGVGLSCKHAWGLSKNLTNGKVFYLQITLRSS